MRALLALPTAILALAGGQAQLVPITSAEAISAITGDIHTQVPKRLRAGFSADSSCSGHSESEQEFTAATQLDSWRCKVELRGVRFPAPCRAQAYVFATAQAGHVRVRWLSMSRYCHEARG
jgi:hypothetical protein